MAVLTEGPGRTGNSELYVRCCGKEEKTWVIKGYWPQGLAVGIRLLLSCIPCCPGLISWCTFALSAILFMRLPLTAGHSLLLEKISSDVFPLTRHASFQSFVLLTESDGGNSNGEGNEPCRLQSAPRKKGLQIPHVSLWLTEHLGNLEYFGLVFKINIHFQLMQFLFLFPSL